MGDFKNAFRRTMKHEGVYSVDPDDRGGETYRGISRRFHPSWPGWKAVDRATSSMEDPSTEDWAEANFFVESFYRANFWDPFCGDELPGRIAEEMFDTAVNMGVSTAVRFLQRALNLLNRHGRSWDDISEDGVFGNETMRTVRSRMMRDMSYLLKLMNILQGMHYIELAERRPSQEKFLRGWLNRVTA